MITKDELNSYRRKSINQHNLKVNNYLHRDFNIEKSKGSLCSKHVILTEEDSELALYSNMIEKESLPKISEMDPQIIWIGGQPGDVIKITPYSEITGFSVVYRLVIPSYGNIIQSPEYNLDIKKITTIKDDDIQNDEIDQNDEDEFIPEDEEFIDDGDE